VHHEREITINRPAGDVWAFVNDTFNMPRLRGMTLGTRKMSPGEMGAGTVLQGRFVILGFEMKLTFHVTDWDPPRAMSATAAGRGIQSLSIRQTFDADGPRTRLRRSLDIEWTLLGKTLALVTEPAIRRRFDAGTDKIKDLLEAEE
jgi:carbon monoxide dehydrogenase subunit G